MPYGVRIVNVDFYMTPPVQDLDPMYSEFRGSSIAQVPIIRIFGSTDSGKKMCLHVHGVFPYFYIPYEGLDDPNSVMYQIAANLDKAINISFGQTSSTTQHIYKICLVSGIPFYGYHNRQYQFLKIYLYNPGLIRKVSTLLQTDTILGKIYQPHETHIPFTMQFMIDYNLHGMSKILLQKIKFRSDADHDVTIREELIKSPSSLLAPTIHKLSSCELEGDIMPDCILNRLEINRTESMVNPGIAAIWADEKQRRRNKNQDSQISPCLTLINTGVPPTKSDQIFKKVLIDRLALLSNESDTVESAENNISVYPAETPRDKHIMNASVIDVPSGDDSLNLSLDHVSPPVELNASLNATLDSDAQILFNVLQGLGDNEENNVEDDCILTQVSTKDNEEEDDDGYLDLSIPLETATTPVKDLVCDDGDDDLDVTLVPQLDGHCDDSTSSDENESTATKQEFKRSRKQYKALPISVAAQKNCNCDGSDKGQFQSESAPQSRPSVKRKLSFVPNQASDVTVIEENLICQLKPNEHVVSFEKSPNKKRILEEYFPAHKSPEDKSGDELFESDSNSPEKILEVTLSKAERYDLETNFMPKEGNSKNLTQISLDLDKQLLNRSNSVDLVPGSLQSSLELSPKQENNVELKLSLGDHKDITSSDTSSNLIPPYQIQKSDTKLNSSDLRVTDPSIHLLGPQHKAPTRDDIIDSLSKYNIPKETYQEPFYSNVEDVTGNVEVGYNVLKIASKTTADLDDFKTIFDGVDSLRKIQMPCDLKWTRDNVNTSKLFFCKPANKIIVPLKCPPSKKAVTNWIKEPMSQSLDLSPVDDLPPERTKIILPGGSPSKIDDVSDLELSLTLTPLDDGETESKDQIESSPVLGKNSKKRKPCKNQSNRSGITGVTLNNTYGFKSTPENYQKARVVMEYEHLSVLVVEVHVQTRGDLKPDPRYDAVRAIFYAIFENSANAVERSGLIAVNALPLSPDKTKKMDIMEGVGVECNAVMTQSETDLFESLAKFVIREDPDILTGYEIELLSWGYLVSRANELGINLVPMLARTKDKERKNMDNDRELKVTGRIVLDFWRLLRYEIALQSYSFENIAYHLLHMRVPQYSFKDLSFWWNHRSAVYRHRTIKYYLLRVRGILKVMEQLDLIGRTSELARLFGIQFYEVLSRGSQFRVESMMLRLAKPMNYIPVSPSVQQRAVMKAPEFLPLILEPESKMYVDPVIVLDFQSLYPSIIMAYNYCFSTCIGKVQHLGKNAPFQFGATQYKIARRQVEKLLKSDSLVFSPCGAVFVKRSIRDGILPKMLREIIDTRLMVKQSMKENRDNKVLQKVLHNRQLGLKLIANVTYGYTAANFSGRMPAVEVADSVVSKGRETLQRAINLVENTPEWGARVVYGDTDSLFVLVKGASKEEAFDVGKKIADAVTNDNPDPVKLKLEKIYQPCILQTKKRYVGYMYESADQKEPVYEAKGIETVRRDGCPVVSKMLEKCLRLLFETRDVSFIKKYVLRQFSKMLVGRVSLQDLTFAKEYRGASGYKPGACVPALELARKWTATDVRNEPRSGERVPYVIANGPPGWPLIRLVRSPRDFLADHSLRPNVTYYITRVIIPPLNRCMKLIGADLMIWFNQMPRKQYLSVPNISPEKKNTISQYFLSMNCAACGQQTQKSLCETCTNHKQETAVVLSEKIRNWELKYYSTKLICESCCGFTNETPCISLDCPVLYRLNQTNRDMQQVVFIREILESVDCGF